MKENDLPLGMTRLVRNYATYSALVAGLFTVWSSLGWGFPLVMAKDYSLDKSGIETRLSKIETAMTGLSIGQLESQELQLQARVQDLEREIARTTEPALLAILSRQKNEAEQALAKVRRGISAISTPR